MRKFAVIFLIVVAMVLFVLNTAEALQLKATKAHFYLHKSPEKDVYTSGDKFDVVLHAEAAFVKPESYEADIYLVFISSRTGFYFGFDWVREVVPAVRNVTIPGDLYITKAPILEVDTTFTKDAPIPMWVGDYIIMLFATEPGTMNLISTIAFVSFGTFSPT